MAALAAVHTGHWMGQKIIAVHLWMANLMMIIGIPLVIVIISALFHRWTSAARRKHLENFYFWFGGSDGVVPPGHY